MNENFSLQEISAAIQGNNDNKSPGIRPSFNKNSVCIEFLHCLFNFSFRTGAVPGDWLKAIIKPVPKTGGKSLSPSEYRGISLQSFITKTYCRIINNRLRDFFRIRLAYSAKSSRPYRSSQDSTFILVSLIENRLLNKQSTFACFITFKKAFDYVDRDHLWFKLKKRYGINGHLLSALKHYTEM